jgi:hypothetical protein
VRLKCKSAQRSARNVVVDANQRHLPLASESQIGTCSAKSGDLKRDRGIPRWRTDHHSVPFSQAEIALRSLSDPDIREFARNNAENLISLYK